MKDLLKKSHFLSIVLTLILLCTLLVGCADEPLGDEHVHTFGAWSAVSGGDCAEAQRMKRACACGEVVYTTLPPLGHTDNNGDGNCEKCGACTHKATKEETCDIHPSSCASAGYYVKRTVCEICEGVIKEETVTIQKLPHTEGELAAKEATCTETGLTQGKVCTECGEITVPQQTLPKTEHIIKNYACQRCDFAMNIDYSLNICGVGAPYFIEIYRDGVKEFSAETDENGNLSFNLPAREYRFTIDAPSDKIVYDTALCVLTPEKSTAQIDVYSKLGFEAPIYGNVEDGAFANYVAADETYAFDIEDGKLRYFIFTPNETGVYMFSVRAEGEAFIGFYGTPLYVSATDLAIGRLNDRAIEIDVGVFNLASGVDQEATQFVIGVSGNGSAFLTVEKVREHETVPEDLAWDEYEIEETPKLYHPDEADLPGYTLKDIDISSKNQKIVYNVSDGFYHYLSVDGPLVLLKIDIATKYLDALSAVCESQRFGCYVYEGGELVAKVSYHEMMLKYIAASSFEAGGIGVYPLDGHLFRAITDVGNYLGWWDLSENSYTSIFGEDKELVVKESAWMFALCYASVEPVAHTVTLSDTDGKAIVGVCVTVVDAEGNELGSAITDAHGVAVITFDNRAEDYYILLDEEILENYIVPCDILLLGKDVSLTLVAVITDGGDADYDPEAKYALYTWKNTDINVQINEHSNGGEFYVNARRFLAGESGNVADIDRLIEKRNNAMSAAVNVSVNYIYVTDVEDSYAYGSSAESIALSVFVGGASAPDVFCDSFYDLTVASLNGCFFNISSDDAKNNFSFTEEGYKAQTNLFGYNIDLMSAMSFSPRKQYVLASDYFIDTQRGLNVIPVNVPLLETVLYGVIGDVDGDFDSDVYDFHSTVLSGEWDWYTLMRLSSAINEADTSCTGIVLNAASEKFASAVLYSADFDLFERRIDKESGGYTCAYTDSEDEFCELLDMLSELALYGGVSVEETTASDIRARFASSSLLFGAVVPLGALEAEDYADMAGEVYIAPVPKLSAEDSYKTTLDGMARLGAINAKSSKIAQATAFLDYQSTHSQEVVEAYYRYELLFGFLSPEKENKESINLIASSFIPTCTSYYDGVVGGHFYSNCDQSATLAKLVSSLRFYISDPKIIWNETVLPRVDYITQIIALVEKLN